MQATVAELEAELKTRKAEAAQAAKQAAEAAAQSERDRAQAERVGKAQLYELGSELKAVLATPSEGRPSGQVRGLSRQWLHGAVPAETPSAAALEDLARHDPLALRLFDLHRRAGAVLVHLGTAAGLGSEDEAFGVADDLECGCWRALMGRIRQLAGEA